MQQSFWSQNCLFKAQVLDVPSLQMCPCVDWLLFFLERSNPQIGECWIRQTGIATASWEVGRLSLGAKGRDGYSETRTNVLKHNAS